MLRVVERNLQKKEWRKHNKGIPKKYRTSFSDYWQTYRKNKRKEGK